MKKFIRFVLNVIITLFIGSILYYDIVGVETLGDFTPFVCLAISIVIVREVRKRWSKKRLEKEKKEHEEKERKEAERIRTIVKSIKEENHE